MGEVTPLHVARKKRKKRKLVSFLFFALLVLGGTYWASYMMYENEPESARSFFSSVFSGGGSGPGYPINSPGGDIKGMYTIGNALGILNDTNLYLYNVGGKLTGSVQHKYSNPQLSCGGSNLLLYDRGSKQYSLYNHDKLLKQITTENQIYTANIVEDGRYAVATGGALHQSSVTVYNNKHEEMWWWKSADKMVTAMDLSANDTRLTLGCTYAKGGQLISSLVMLDTSKEEPLGEIVLEDELILEIRHNARGVSVLTDRQIFICDAKGAVLQSFSFEGQMLCGYAMTASQIVVVTGDYQHDRFYNMTAMTSDLKVVGTGTVSEKINSIQSNQQGIYLLTNNRLKVYSPTCALQKDLSIDDIQKIHTMGRYLYTVTGSEVQQLDFS